MRSPHYQKRVDFKWDKGLILCLILFMGISLLAIWCATPLMSQVSDPESYWIRQGIWYLVSIIAVLFCLKLGTERFYTGVKIFYWILLFLLGLLLVDRYFFEIGRAHV